jgi:hypothetical protein
MNPLFSACPVCGGELVITKISCPSCETTYEGSFHNTGTTHSSEMFKPQQLKMLLPLMHLSPEQLFFVLTFVRSEGRFNRMEEELGMSYPTLRNRLDEILRAMGFDPAPDPAPAPRSPGPAERQEILDALERGDIEMEQARRRLSGESD